MHDEDVVRDGLCVFHLDGHYFRTAARLAGEEDISYRQELQETDDSGMIVFKVGRLQVARS
jgi:hypothetical protein